MTTPKFLPVALSAVRRGDVVLYPDDRRRVIDRAYQVDSEHASVPFEVRVDFSDGSFDQFLDWSFELPLIQSAADAEPLATDATRSALVPVESLLPGDVFLPSIDGDVLTVLTVDPEGEGPGTFQVRSERGVKAVVRLAARSAVILVRRPALTDPELGRRAAAIEAAAGATLVRQHGLAGICASNSGRFVSVRLSGEDAGTVLIDRATGQVQVCGSLLDAQAEADVLADLPADGTGQTRTTSIYGLRTGDVVLTDGDRREVLHVATVGHGQTWSAVVTFTEGPALHLSGNGPAATRFVVEAAR